MIQRISIASLLLLILLILPSLGAAREFRQAQIPNGYAFNCNVCHDKYPPWNNRFGTDTWDLLSSPAYKADVPWSQLALMDSDGDGFTNGEELGDPDGHWMMGMPSPDGPVTDPSSPLDSPVPPNPCADLVCDDASACTDDTCVDGQCKNTLKAPCDDGDPCTQDSCSPASGCVFEPIANCGRNAGGNPPDAGGASVADRVGGADAGTPARDNASAGCSASPRPSPWLPSASLSLALLGLMLLVALRRRSR